jgi:hypothetical protein
MDFLTETYRFLCLLQELGIKLVCISAGSPYYNPHLTRPALFPPSDGYQAPEDPLAGVVRLIEVTSEIKARFPELAVVGSPRGRASSTSGATRPFRNRASFSALASMRGRYAEYGAWRDASVVCERSGGWESRPERGATPVRNEKARPAQQVGAQPGKQEAVRRGPANGLAHL